MLLFIIHSPLTHFNNKVGHYFIVIKGIVASRELEVFAGDGGNG
jgi:hypothetical protein